LYLVMFNHVLFQALLMFHKWTKYYANNIEEDFPLSERCAPSILISFINMILHHDNNDGIEAACETGNMYWGQSFIQSILLLVALGCVPVMLLAKPLILRRQHLQKPPQQRLDVNGASGAGGDHPVAEEPFEFGEVLILQGIHTIEYVLGSVSHTASYLRLWALSLAHAQLSEVLWNMVLAKGLGIDGW